MALKKELTSISPGFLTAGCRPPLLLDHSWPRFATVWSVTRERARGRAKCDLDLPVVAH